MSLAVYTQVFKEACDCSEGIVSISTCSGLRLAPFFEAMLPAAEKRRSDGVDVAGIHSRDFASFASVG